MGPTRDDFADDPAAAPAAYCRQCGYDLRGLPTGHCPECGGAFDPANRKTLARKPPRSWVWRWVGRVAVAGLLLGLAWGSVPGWYWWQWHKEQAAIAGLQAMGATVSVQREPRGGLARCVPTQLGFVHSRATAVEWRTGSNEGVAGIDFAALDGLVRIDLRRHSLGDATLFELGRCRRLLWVALPDNLLDGSGLRYWTECPQLFHLDLSGTRLDDSGLAHVGRFRALETLSVARTRVTDAGLVGLDGLRSLRSLDVSGTAVTIAGLRRLRGLPALGIIRAEGAWFTADDLEALRAVLPNVIVMN